MSARVEFGATIVSSLFSKLTCGGTAAIESRGICCTGLPVGPEGRGGSGSGCFFLLLFRWIWDLPCDTCPASATAGIPAHTSPELRSTTLAIFFHFDAVLMTGFLYVFRPSARMIGGSDS